MADILLSVLIPSIIEREAKLGRLMEVLAKQADPRLEVLVYLDDRTVPLGEKRNDLMRRAEGRFLCHIDDDDCVTADFFEKLLPKLQYDCDLIAYNASVIFNGGKPFTVRTLLGAANEQPRHLPEGGYSDIVRTPWHWCCWRTTLARQFAFVDHHGAEDALWLAQILPKVESWIKLEQTLFIHEWSPQGSTFDRKK